MNTEQVKAEIIKMPQFSGFTWTEDSVIQKALDSSKFATMPTASREFKDSEKREYKLNGPYAIFIAHMYEGEVGKEFFYILVYRKGEVREFRKHNFYGIEYNKIYVSGKTVEEVVNNLQERFDQGYEFS
jgi:hypothetical protein